MNNGIGSQLGKEYIKAVYCHSAYLTIYRYFVQNAELDEAQAGITIVGRNINNLKYADDTTLMAERKEQLKHLLMKEESEKTGLKLSIKKNEDHGIWFHHFMANRWGKCRNRDRFHFLGLQNHCGQ